MRNFRSIFIAFALWTFPGNLMVSADDGQVFLANIGTNTFIQVQGDKDDEWRFQSSSDLLNWKDAPLLGTVFSSKTNSVPVQVNSTNSMGFYRSVKTTGLYDTMVLRTISLNFTQANWKTLLTNGRTTGSNTVCTLEMDNGITIYGAGARYKGNSSFGGMGGSSPAKKSLNIELDYTNSASRLMGYKTINLNNAYADETIMRESLYFNVMQKYAVSPKCSLVKLYINSEYWGVYSFAQQGNADLMDEWFSGNDGDRWRAPNMGGMIGGRPGGGGTSASSSALAYLGTNIATYKNNYELKSDNSTNAWERLYNAIYVLNNTPAAQLRDKAEEVMAVDSWLWFLAIENMFTDEDSYYSKGADYCFYYEPESGRMHPVEYDGNESMTTSAISLSPVQGASDANRPVLKQFLSIPELRQRYLAHMRTVLKESFHPDVMIPIIDQTVALWVGAIIADTKKGFTMATYTNDLNSLKTFVKQRYSYLTNHAELKPLQPVINAVHDPVTKPLPSESPFVTAEVKGNGTEGIDSVWLYYRGASYGRFQRTQMFDDGTHGDGAANDGIFGGATTNYPAGTKVRYYVEARSSNSAKAAVFSPARAEQDTYSYRVGLAIATNTSVVINEFMASNSKTLADNQGGYDDWIELRNITSNEIDLTGLYLSDEANNPRKWAFPAGTKIPANGYLLVWADEDGSATTGLHANFKLSATGEQIYLIDRDANLNAVLDSIEFGIQYPDISYGREASNPSNWGIMIPTPGRTNQ